MKSSFVSKSREMRKTFIQKEQILTVLCAAKKNQWLTSSEIATIANHMGWTRPVHDTRRRAVSHPYSKILSSMTDKNHTEYFVPNLEERHRTGKKMEYRLVAKKVANRK